MSLDRISKYLRLKAFDTTTDKGRANERYRLALFALGASLLSRATSMVTMIFTVSLTIPYLGVERFGVWMTISSLAGVLTFFDLGVGNALTNKVTEAASKKDPELLMKTVSGGLGLLLLMSGAMMLLLNAASFALPWDNLIKVNEESTRSEMRISIHVFLALFSMTIFTSGVQRVFHGLQRGFESHIISIAGSLIALGILWWVASIEAGIPWLLASGMAGQLASCLLLLRLLIKRRQFKPAQTLMNVRSQSQNLIKVGGLFFLLQLGTVIGWGADSLIISSTLGPTSVAIFSITQKLFLFASQPLAMANAPLWPAFADARCHGDKPFIRHTLRKALLGNLIFGLLLSLILLSVADILIAKWTSEVINVPLALLVLYAIWTVCDVLANAFAMFMNGCNIVKPQVYGVVALVIISLPLKLFLIAHHGMEAMLAGFTLFFVLNIFFWYGAIFRQEISQELGLIK